MELELIFENQQSKLDWTPELQTALVRTLEALSRRQEVNEQAEVGITIVDNAQIQLINAEYRGIDQPTDVISFALNDETDEPGVSSEIEQYLLGDIIISLEQAAEQALEFGHSLQREVAFLGAHGLLHLLGFDHQDELGEAAMQQVTEEVLSSLGIKR